MNELLNLLLDECRAIRPDVRFVRMETYVGDYPSPTEFWALAGGVAFTGETPTELMDELRASISAEPQSKEPAIDTVRLMEVIGGAI